MSPVIRISDDLFGRLEQHAHGFDTPANVIERLVDHYEGVGPEKSTLSPNNDQHPARRKGQRRDTTKYIFNSRTYPKNRLVLAVVHQYVKDNHPIDWKELLEAFPRDLQGSAGVFDTKEAAKETLSRTGYKRHFLESDEVIELADTNIAVSTQWGIHNMDDFVERAQELGYDIKSRP